MREHENHSKLSLTHGQPWCGCLRFLCGMGQSAVPQGSFHSHQGSERRHHKRIYILQIEWEILSLSVGGLISQRAKFRKISRSYAHNSLALHFLF